jgi:hypothetical protein
VLHSCLTAALICGQKHSACQIIADEGAGQKEEEKTEETERKREREERRMREEGRWGYANRSIHGNQEILRCAF